MKNVIILLMCAGLMSCGGGDSGGNDFSNDTQYGPTACYPFDENTGNIAYNSEFDAFHGEIVGVSREVGKIGNAYDFSNTIGAHILFDICCYADPDTGEGEILVTFPDNRVTLAAWLHPTTMAMDEVYPIFGGWYGSVQSMKLRVNNGTIEFMLYPQNNADPISIIASASTIENDAWTHVAVTYDGSQAVIYVNGIEDAYFDIVTSVEDIVNDYFIGGIPTSHSAGPGEHSFPGLIDEFVFSLTALSQTEIEALVAAGN